MKDTLKIFVFAGFVTTSDSILITRLKCAHEYKTILLSNGKF